jgi:multiple sugar transport system permease protein
VNAEQGAHDARAWADTAVGVLILAVMLFPIYWMVNGSLQPNGNTLQGRWWPASPNLSGYWSALQDQGRHLLTSLIVAIGAASVSLVIATPAAYALIRFSLRGSKVILLGILITQMIPGIAVANALYAAYSKIGLLNAIPGLILADCTTGIPFAIIVIMAFMETIPAEILDAARVDGAGHVRTLWSIVVPVSRNALITAGIFAFLFAWSDFLFALTLTTDESVRPVTLGIYLYLGAHVSNWSGVMATAVLASIPAAVLLVVAQRYITAGATGGAVK